MATHRVEYQDADHLRHSDFDDEDEANAEAQHLTEYRLRVNPDTNQEYVTHAPGSSVGEPAYTDVKVVEL